MDIPTKIERIEAKIAVVEGKLRNTVPRLEGETNQYLLEEKQLLEQQLANWTARLPLPSASGASSSQLRIAHRGTFDDFASAPPPKCLVVKVSLMKTPSSVRRKFANQLHSVGKTIGRKFHGYIRRLTQNELQIVIVTLMPQNKDEEELLGELWHMLLSPEGYNIPRDYVSLEKDNCSNVPDLAHNFRVVGNPDGGGNGWSNDATVEFDVMSNAYSVVSSIH